MFRCDVPGCPGSASLPFTCKSCGKQYCAKHRLPENHACIVPRQGTFANFFGYYRRGGRRRSRRGRCTRTPKQDVKRVMKIAILVSVIGGGFGIYVYLDWTYNFTGPQHSTVQYIQLVMTSSYHVAIYNFTLVNYRERLDIGIDADQMVSAYMLDEVNFGYYLYCQISTYCPSVSVLTSFEYTRQGSLQVTQKKWHASSASDSGFHLIVVGPDMATTHVNVTIVEYHW